MPRAYHEVQKPAGTVVVESGSADPGVAGCASVSVDDADHAGIARPDSPAAPVFRCVAHLVDQAAAFADAGGRVAVFGREIAEVVRAMKANGAFAIAFLRRCRQLIDAGQLRIEDGRTEQGQASNNGLDKMLLYAWYE